MNDIMVTKLYDDEGLPAGLHVDAAPSKTLISAGIYQEVLLGSPYFSDVQAAEGLMVIYAANGTYRYALDTYDLTLDCWTAHRIYPKDTPCVAP